MRGLVLLSLRVNVDEVDVDVRQETGAVVDPLHGVAQRAGNGSALSTKNKYARLWQAWANFLKVGTREMHPLLLIIFTTHLIYF